MIKRFFKWLAGLFKRSKPAPKPPAKHGWDGQFIRKCPRCHGRKRIRKTLSKNKKGDVMDCPVCFASGTIKSQSPKKKRK